VGWCASDLTDWRLTLARDYLLAGELTLEQIAHRTGYSSPNAFAAAFRRHVGLAPGQWRQQHRSKPSIQRPVAQSCSA
jgi:AraC-like DNA-binding protein